MAKQRLSGEFNENAKIAIDGYIKEMAHEIYKDATEMLRGQYRIVICGTLNENEQRSTLFRKKLKRKKINEHRSKMFNNASKR